VSVPARLTVNELPLAITALTPQSVATDSGAFTLTVDGTGFLQSTGTGYYGYYTGTQVQWNGASRPTTFVNSTTLTATLPATDIAGFTGIATAVITVLNPTTGELSNAKSFAITPSTVVAVQSDVSTTDSSVTVSTAPTIAGNAGVTATLQNNTEGTGAATITVANYDPQVYSSSNPPPAPALYAGSGYVDVQATNVDATDTATTSFYYPSDITGTDETDLLLQYYNGTAWQTVLSSGGVAPVKDITDNLDGTVSGGRFTVVFDDTSTPKLTELTGTVFAFGPPASGGKNDKHKPQILTDPVDQTVTVGADVTFSVTVKPGLPVTYQWHCDGKKGPVIAGATQATLVLHNVTMADADKYVVVVTNRNGSTTSKKATLTVLPLAPAIATAPQSQTINSGDNVTFTVNATSETPPDYQWYFNGKKIGGEKDAVLTLKKVSLSDAGAYSVVVSNDGGEVTSAAATLTVVVPAITTLSPATVIADTAAFTLTVNGTGFANGATVKWNGADRSTQFVNSTVLTASISAGEIENAKTVSITVRSPSGDASNAMTLTIALPHAPVIAAAPQSQTVSSGGTVTFTATATSDVAPSYQWLFKGKAIGGAKSASLTLSNVALSNAGAYSVVVSNDGGSTTSVAATLTVLAPTIASIDPATVNAGSGAFTLTVTGANFVNGAVVRWDGDARPTTFVNSTTLTASIPAKDIPAKKKNGKGQTLQIAVKSPSGDCSNAQTLTIAP
jgi:hypothetical protein